MLHSEEKKFLMQTAFTALTMANGQPCFNQESNVSALCAVCRDIWDNPLTFLECQHTFCRKCVNDLFSNSPKRCPPCPECRKPMQREKAIALRAFKELSENEREKNRQEISYGSDCIGNPVDEEANATKLRCGFCELDFNINKLYYCENCECVLCEICRRSHLKRHSPTEARACCLEDTHSLLQTYKTYEAALTEQCQYLDTEIDGVKKKLENSRVKYKDIEENAVLANRAAEQVALQAVTEHFHEQEAALRSETQRCHEKAEQVSSQMVASLCKCKEAIDGVKMCGLLEILCRFKSLTCDSSTVRNKSSKLKNPEMVVSYEDQKPLLTWNLFNLSTQISFQTDQSTELKSSKFQVKQKHILDLSEVTSKLLLIKNKLWCFMETGIEIRDCDTGIVERKVDVDFGSCWGADVTEQGYVIAASRKGLFSISSKDYVVNTIIVPQDEYLYHDVIAHNNQIIALKENCKKNFFLQTFSWENGCFDSFEEIPTDLGFGFPAGRRDPVTMVAHKDKILVCCWFNNSIYQFQDDGSFTQILGRSCNLKNPLFCGSGKCEGLLIADSGNNRFQLLELDIKKPQARNEPVGKPRAPASDEAEEILASLSEVQIDGPIMNSRAAVYDQHGRLFCTGTDPPCLYICTSLQN